MPESMGSASFGHKIWTPPYNFMSITSYSLTLTTKINGKKMVVRRTDLGNLRVQFLRHCAGFQAVQGAASPMQVPKRKAGCCQAPLGRRCIGPKMESQLGLVHLHAKLDEGIVVIELSKSTTLHSITSKIQAWSSSQAVMSTFENLNRVQET